ncbi:MAG TPA: alpha/beta fold hydrolase [Nannocystaceae bacterium]|nr:alpha/beta fold hydrolase [Nannocystaceae bacterium]
MPRRLLAIVVLLATACLPPPPTSDVAPTQDDKPVVRRLLAARKPGEIYQPGEVRSFAVRQGGHRIGTSWGRYVGPTASGGHRFETRIELEVPGRAAVRSAGELELDASGRVVKGFERSDAVELTFERKTDVLVFSDGEKTDEIGYAPERVDTAVMAHSAILHAELMFALREITTGELAWRLVSLSGGPPIEWSAKVLDATDDGERIRLETSLGEIVTLAEGRVNSIEVIDSQLEIVAEPNPQWPKFAIKGPQRLAYAPAADAHFTLRELELPGKADEPALAGELVIPSGVTSKAPAVLFVSGTGLEDRHGYAGPPPVDLGSHELTDALAEAGFVVLRFDERGRGKSEAGALGFLAQVSDARRALATLLVQPEVDPDRIVVIGHGEGGLRALVLASERSQDVHAVALLATPGRPYEQILRAQADGQLARLPPETREQARTQQKQMLDDLVSGKRTPPELEPQAQWLREIFAVRPAELVGRLRVPLLLAQGGKDFEVDPGADPEALARAARRAKVKHELKRYPQLDHLFKPEPNASGPERYLVDRRVDTVFIADVIAWAKRVTTAK